ncbi:MAG: hypothetical protein MJK12_21520 [Colwellia sp.]|nr:hypothetical protein [Colwellia sp.]
MFEWGGGTIWCANDAARKKYDVGPVEERLSLSKEILDDLQLLTELHDGALNWNYPPDPSPWTKQQFESFEEKAIKMLEKVKVELGHEYDVQYDTLG